MPEESDLTVIEQREVTFYDDELTAVRTDDGQVYVSVRHMCQALGIKRPQRQTDRIKRDEVLNDGLRRVPIMGTRGRQRTYVLRVDLAPLWLAGIEASRVSDAVRTKIVRYKREVAKVLWEAFQEGRLTADPTFDELLQADTDAVQAYKTALAVVRLARSQILLEARVDSVEGRLEAIEATLGDPDRFITEEQATQISQAVRTIALLTSKRTKQNEYGRTWGEFYRKFGVSKYRHLPAAKFDEAMKWLNDWHGDLTGDVPF